MRYITGLKQTGKKGIYKMQFRYKKHRINQTTGTTKKSKALGIIIKTKFDLMRREGADECYIGKNISFKDASMLVLGVHFCHLRSVSVLFYQLEVLEELIGDLSVANINNSTFASLERQLNLRGCSSNTINKYFSAVNVVLKTVRKYYSAPCAPVPYVKLKIKRKHIRSISKNEDQSIRGWMNNPKAVYRSQAGWSNQDLIEIYEIGILTGMRRGEIFGFLVDQIHRQTIHLEPEQHKTGDSTGTKAIILSEKAVQILDSRIKRLGLKEKNRVFPYSKYAFTKLWRRMKKDLNLSEDHSFTPHCMRHTFATHMAEKGMPIYQLSKMLGHTTVKTTEMYAHLFTDELVAAMNKYS